MKDKFNIDIQVGDYIIYVSNMHRQTGLRFGKVLMLQPAAGAIQVLGIDDTRQYDRCVGVSYDTVRGGDQVLIINRDQIPEEYLQLLDSEDVDPVRY